MYKGRVKMYVMKLSCFFRLYQFIHTNAHNVLSKYFFQNVDIWMHALRIFHSEIIAMYVFITDGSEFKNSVPIYKYLNQILH